jgi:hypothetical protein
VAENVELALPPPQKSVLPNYYGDLQRLLPFLVKTQQPDSNRPLHKLLIKNFGTAFFSQIVISQSVIENCPRGFSCSNQ